MFPLVLETKLYFPPIRPILVSRPHLVERLQSGLKGSLTLLSAPAGYGKTTLLGEWRLGPGKDTPIAWLSIDSEDNDLGRFLLYICTSLDTVQPGLMLQVQPLLHSLEVPNPEAVLTLLVNQLSLMNQDFMLVLDDYHLITTPAIHRALSFLIDHMPPQMHMVILTRSDPAFPLSRLRARNQLIEIRAEHLRFSLDETAQFLTSVMGLNLSNQDVAALEALTEGWIASLQLAALSLQGREDVQDFISVFTGSHHYIMDYLVEEVLHHQPETVRDFLVKTSILDRLTGPLCDVLTGNEDGANILAMLVHANLFIIPLDNEQTWYRFHHLFSDLLQNHLLQVHPKIVKGLHNNASEWFEANGFQDEAIAHALKATNFERAARLLCRDSLQAIYTSYKAWSELGSLLRAFPAAFLLSDPWLCIAKAHVLWTSGKWDEMEPYILSAQKVLDEKIKVNLISAKDHEIAILHGQIFAFHSLIEARRNESSLAVKYAKKAVHIIPEDARNRVFALGCLYSAYQLAGDIAQAAKTSSETIAAARSMNYFSMHATASFTLARLLRVQGKLHRAAQIIQESLEYVKQRGQELLYYTGILHIALAEILYDWNSLDEMENELETGIALCRQGGMSTLVLIGLEDRAILKHAQGDVTGAFEVLDEIERDCKGMDPKVYKDTCTLFRLRWQAGQEDTSGLEDWLQGFDHTVESKISIDRFAPLAVAAEFFCALNRCDEAMQILESVGTYVREAGYSGWVIFVSTLEAVVWKRKRNETHALDCLKQALELAEPEGYMRVFINQGEPMRKLLIEAKNKGIKPEFISHILAAYENQPLSRKQSQKTPAILSKREMELLRLIAAGYSNKQIGSELFISIGTVKRHTANIFDRLDVKNRTEAVARARELNLLS